MATTVTRLELTPHVLQVWRRHMGWTQEQACRWYGCSIRAWQYWESGDRRIPFPLVRRIQAGGALKAALKAALREVQRARAAHAAAIRVQREDR